MADLDFLKTFPGQFRGATFLIRSASTTNGRKSVVHEFLNTDRRVVEDLGGRLDSFSIECITTRGRTGFNGDYERNKLALKRALEAEGPGLLIHPFFGKRVVNVINFTINESMTEFGTANFSITFEQSKPNIFPSSSNSANNVSGINSSANSAFNFVSSNIGDRYKDSNISSRTLLDSANKIRSVGDLFENIFNRFRAGSALPNEFFRDINNFKNDSLSLAKDSVTLGKRIIGLFNSANNYAIDSQEAYDIGVSTFSFGDDDIPIIGTTVDLLDRRNNLTIINETVQSAGLVQAYRSAALIDFDTQSQVNFAINTLALQFEKFESFTLSNQNILQQVNNLRNQLRILLDSVGLSLSEVVTVKTNQIPMTVLAYNYYGSTDNVDALLGLNPNQEPSFVEGDVEIFSQ